MPGLGTSIKTDDRVCLPAPRQRIDKMSFPAIAKAQPQHRSKTRRAHGMEGYSNKRFHHLPTVEEAECAVFDTGSLSKAE